MTSGEPPPDADPAAVQQTLLERRLRGRPRPERVRIGHRPAGVSPPLSFAQERLWFMEQFAPGTLAYVNTALVRLRGELDPAALQGALDAVAARHEALRTRIRTTDLGEPVAHVEPAAGIPLRVVDLDPGANGGDGERRAHELATEEARRPFDLAAGPLLRALLVRLDAEDHVLLLAAHHAVTDGWATETLIGEVVEHHRALRAGTAPAVPELPVQYGDYACWQRQRLAGGALDGDVSYWAAQLAGLPPLDLPADRPRPASQSFDGASHRFWLDADLTGAVAGLGRSCGATLFMTLLAAYHTLLARYSGQWDFAIGSPVAGQTRPELRHLVGMFVNMLTLRLRSAPEITFLELQATARHTVVEALAHQELPFEQIVNQLGVERDVSRSPLFQASFALLNYRMRDHSLAGPGGPGLSVAWEPLELPAARFDLDLQAVEVQGRLLCKLTYGTALYTEPTIARMAGHLGTLLRSIVERPDAPLAGLPLLGPEERTLVVEGWNATAADVDEAATLTGLVEAQVARTPAATAVVFEDERLTFAELDARANRVAHGLRRQGVGPEVLVGVCAERSLELVVGLLGVLKAGGAYVPLDPDYPPDRLAFMIGDAAAPVLLTQRHLAGRLPATDVAVLLLDDPAAWAGEPDAGLPQLAAPASAAYVIYTSGSTGRPKGVPNTHRAICNRLDWMQRTYRLTAGDVVLQKTPASFDVSVWEFFWPLLAGARLVLVRPGGHRDGAHLRDVIVERGVTTAHFVPSMLATFLAEDGVESCTSLRRVICSGEELPPPVALQVLERLPGCELHNLYGPTEAAIDVSAWRCEPAALAGAATVPIGRPIQNVRLHVLDARLEPLPAGVPGELFIGGAGLARGYLGRPGLTAERFVPDPLGPPGSRLYRTGDLARWRSDGALEFCGRLDHQVKLRGQRIELGEIETVLRGVPGVREAAVLVREDVPGDRRLVAYVTPERGAAPAAQVLRGALRESLPEYMVPAAYVVLDALPLGPTGKLDRRALPRPEREPLAGEELAEPRTAVERTLTDVWQDVLQIDRLGIDDDFFDLGGHSLLATQVVARLRRALDGHGRPVGVMDLFKNRTIRELAALIERPVEGDEPRRLLHELTRPVPAARRAGTFVCVPYGGGSAVVYQPLADGLPAGWSLYSVAIPGHDVGLDEDALPFEELARRCADEVLERVEGPLVLYGHCGVGGALVVEIARRLEAAGRRLEAVYVGAIFPFARPGGALTALSRLRTALEELGSNRSYANWLKSMGVDMDELDPEQADRIIRNMRRDGLSAEEYFTTLFDRRVTRLRAPIISVAGDRDPATYYWEERYREWLFLADVVAVVRLEEAGHFFLRYRAVELAEIVTRTHLALAEGTEDRLDREARGPDGWWLEGVRRPQDGEPEGGRRPAEPGLRRFLAVALGQLISMTGSALTQWAIPVWIYLHTASLVRFGLFGVVSLVPGLLVAPLAGGIVDRTDRRRVMALASLGAGGAELALAVLLATGHLQTWHLYGLLVLVSVALAFQRIAYMAAIPQLVPKRFLGHATGMFQMSTGFATLLVPLLAAGLLAAIGLGGILAVDIATYGFALAVLAAVRFPHTMGWRPREPLLEEIANGFRYSWDHRGLRALLLFSAVANVFLAAPLILVAPLVLSFASLAQVGQVTFIDAVGAVVGGLIATVWGGPRRRRLLGMLLVTFPLAACCALTGLRPALPVVAAGAFGTTLTLLLINAIYITIVQVKVPQRFHGRVFAINQLIAWSTLPVGFVLIGPLAAGLLDPLLVPGGALAPTVGAVIGVGAGRGIGLLYLLMGLAMAVLTVVGLRLPVLARFDAEVPDALPDDLVGAREQWARRTGREGEAA